MSAAGIIAHRLYPRTGPTALVWWAAGDGNVQKVANDGSYAEWYDLGGASVRQAITTDVSRNRVFVPTNAGLYIFEDATVSGVIPVPDVVALSNMGNFTAWTWINAISLDNATGQLFLAGASQDNVTIVNPDNTRTVVTGIDQAFYVTALGSGRFSVVKDFNTAIGIYGPANNYAAPLFDIASPGSATIQSTAYDPVNKVLYVYFDTDEGGLWSIDTDTGTTGFVDIDNHYGFILYRVSSTGHIILDQSGDLGKLWVYNPSSSALITTIDYSGAQPGSTLSGSLLDMKHINDTLCVLQRWSLGGNTYVVRHLISLTTGAVLASDPIYGNNPGGPYVIGADPLSEQFAVAHSGNFKLYTINSFAPYDTGELFLADTGANTVAYTYSPET
jgi:hypothetical protein